MSTQSVGWAPSNPWFAKGFDKSITKTLDEVTIRILPLPYFLATKMEAFLDRGFEDMFASHDLEDITYLFNYTFDIDKQILNSEPEVKAYLIEKLMIFLNNNSIQAAMRGSLHYSQGDARMDIINERIKRIIHYNK